MSSPTQRTLERCRRLGWLAHVVERRLPKTHTTVDLFGGIDVLALDGRTGSLGIQATSGSNVSSRLRKLSELQSMREWLAAGNRLEVWGWVKRAPRGFTKRGTKRKAHRWEVRRVRATLDPPTADGAIRWIENKAEEASPVAQ